MFVKWELAEFDGSHSPACILSLFITASVRGEVGEVWNWSDDVEREKRTSNVG